MCQHLSVSLLINYFIEAEYQNIAQTFSTVLCHIFRLLHYDAGFEIFSGLRWAFLGME